MMVSVADAECSVDATFADSIGGDLTGRLLFFFKAGEDKDGSFPHSVDASEISPATVAVAAYDLPARNTLRRVTVDLDRRASPTSICALVPGPYQVQAVLDRNRDYARFGRGPGDVVSSTVQLTLPLRKQDIIVLDHVLAERTAEDRVGSSQADRERLEAAREFIHDESVESAVLKAFSGSRTTVRAWVLVPPGYEAAADRTWPVVYLLGAYSSNHLSDLDLVTRLAQLNSRHLLPPMIWVFPDFATPTGATEFADGANFGPWGRALTTELIPALEKRYRMDSRASGRFVMGHSSGGWSSVWLKVNYPGVFDEAWATAPDPVDFHDFIGVNLYEPAANMYYGSNGSLRQMVRVQGRDTATIRDWVKLEDVLGSEGGTLRSFDWTFSPRAPSGKPATLFNHETGEIDPVVATYWREHYDIARKLERLPASSRKRLEGRLHVIVGDQDTFRLDGAVREFRGTLERLGLAADIRIMAGKNHNDLYARDGNPWALLEEMVAAMYSRARPHGGSGKSP